MTNNQNPTPEELYESYLQGTCNAEEKRLVEDWYNQISAISTKEQVPEVDYDRLRDAIWNQLPPVKQIEIERPGRRIFSPLRIAIAASLLICGGLVTYQYALKDSPAGIHNDPAAATILPGRNKAYLTLSTGQRILLDDSSTKNIQDQGGIEINKTADGQLTYTIDDQGQSDLPKTAAVNKIEIPKGGQYQLILPDGTKVWLNSSSSLKYPASFATLKERKVELFGEAYFEVKHQDNMPFKVISGTHEIKVLGTHFNVMAYPEEQAIRTTLLQGSVGISNGAYSMKIKPGEESVSSGKTKQIAVEKADLEKAMAWKNGRFEFANSELPEIMRQLSRWYDVTIDYRLTANPGKFGGGISKDQTLEEVLKLIEGNGICHFKVEGRKVVVLP
ncbi:FecR family protein [Pedobacter gandavensis]|uniref:FecR family protein n=1 Tax=Pedobacter gandavensis TaxID=2679963 RepID=UPI00292EBD31|nr:FecR domain-containing protein [Pedobacter gandavensis]